jgi:hypothetical protein
VPCDHSTKAAFGPTLSHGGEIAVMASTERTGKPQFSLPAFDTHGEPTAVTTESFSHKARPGWTTGLLS